MYYYTYDKDDNLIKIDWIRKKFIGASSAEDNAKANVFLSGINKKKIIKTTIAIAIKIRI